MSYAVSFRKRDGLNTLGQTVWIGGAFWSPVPVVAGRKVEVTNERFSIPIEVEVLCSQYTSRKGVLDYPFRESK